MKPDLDVLWIAAAALTVSAASLSAFGLRQPRYRGWRWWVAAAWLTALGVAVAAGLPRAQALAELLLLQWPLVTLIGLRRFHARTALPLTERHDRALLALAALAVASTPLWPAAFAVHGAAHGAAPALLLAWVNAGVHLYAAALCLHGPAGRDGLPLKGLAGVLLAVGLGPPALAWGAAGSAGIELRAIAAALGSVVTGFAAMTLVAERSERRLRDAHQRLRALANFDALTRAPNRRHFDELATQALRADRPGSATLLMFDVDHFKRINDGLGHAAGDRALQLVSGCVQAQLRGRDVFGRQGGDEFLLLLRDTPVAGAVGVAARIVERLQSQAALAGLPQLSLSFGMVQLLPGERLGDAVRRADQALYEAKRQGRGCAVMAAGAEDQPVFSESQRLGLTPC